MLWGEVLYQHVRESRVGRQVLQQALKRFEPSSRRADADDRRRWAGGRRRRWSAGIPARRRIRRRVRGRAFCGCGVIARRPRIGGGRWLGGAWRPLASPSATHAFRHTSRFIERTSYGQRSKCKMARAKSSQPKTSQHCNGPTMNTPMQPCKNEHVLRPPRSDAAGGVTGRVRSPTPLARRRKAMPRGGLGSQGGASQDLKSATRFTRPSGSLSGSPRSDRHRG